MLSLLTEHDVQFVVVGPAAAEAHGVPARSALRSSFVLDVTPAPDERNLARLCAALTTATWTALRTDPLVPVTPVPAMFEWMSFTPLATALGPVNVVLCPVGWPGSYHHLRGESTRLMLDDVEVWAPCLPALIRGLLGGAASPDPRLLREVRQQERQPEHLPGIASSTTDVRRPAFDPVTPVDEDNLDRQVLGVLTSAGVPVTVRDINASLRSTVLYDQVRDAAERLRVQGVAERQKSGRAYVYSAVGDSTDWTVSRISALLADSEDPEKVLTEMARLRRGR